MVLAWAACAVVLAAPAGPFPGQAIAELATDVPLQTGVRVRVEAPHRIRIAGTVGLLPGRYLDLVNATAVSAGAYGEDTARLVKKSLTRSLVLRIAGGWRPFPRRGLYAEAGYTWVALGGDVAGEDLVALATGIDPPDTLGSRRDYDVDSTLHLLGAELGWEWRLRARPVVLRASLGVVTTVAARTSIEPRFRPLAPALVDAFTTGAEDYLDRLYLDHVHAPAIAASAGYAF